MPGAGNSEVSIIIRVEDQGSGAISNVETKLTGLGTAGTAASAKMATMAPALEHAGAAGATFASNATSAAAAAGAGYENLRGKMDSVRLASEEMGIRVPRAMARVIASNETLAAGLNATMGLFVAIGAVAIFEQLGEGVYHLYEKWFDLTKEVEAYQQKAQEAAETKLFDTASLETTSALLDQIKSQIDEMEQHRKNTGADQPGGGLMNFLARAGGGFGGEYATGEISPETAEKPFGAADDKALADSMGKRQQLTERQEQLDGQANERRLEEQKQYDTAVLQGYAKAATAQRDADAITSQHYDNLRARATELAKAAGVSPDVLKGQYNAEEQAAYDKNFQDRQAANINQSRTDQQAITAAQNAATNSHLAGVALIRSQEAQAIEAAKGGINEIAAIREKYDQQVLDKIAEEQYETQKMQQTAAQTGLTGVAKMRAEGNEKVTDLWDNPANRGLSEDARQERGIALEQQTDAEILDARKKFNQEMDQLSMRADAQMEEGYARIEADAARTRAAISKDFTEGYGQLPNNDPERIAAEQRLQAALANVDQNAQRERAAYTQKTDEQISQTEAEAARAYLPAWQAAQERIEDDYTQRLAKIKYDVAQHVLTEQQGARAATAAWQLANNEMERQQEETRDRLAGQLSSLFDNPAKYMEDRAKKLMFDILANWMMQLTEAKGPMGSTMAWIFGMSPEMSTSTNPKTALGSIFAPQHGAAGAGGTAALSAAGSTLTSAGSTLNAAGTTLSSSGTMLTSAAESLNAAAMRVSSITAQASGGTGAGFGGGGSTPGGGTGDFADMFGTGGTGAAGGGFQPSDINQAPTSASGVMGTVPGMAAAAGVPGAGVIGQSTSLLGTLAKGGVFGSSAQQFMGAPSTSGSTGMSAPLPAAGLFSSTADMNGFGGGAGLSPDSTGFGAGINPDSTGVGAGLNPDTGETVGGDSSGGSSLGLGQGLGIGMAAIGAGMTFAQNWGNPNVGHDMLSDAMAGASLGTAIMPGIGTAIGAIEGAFIGLFGSLFGDHGASKMRQYNQEQVIPAITKEMTAYTAAEVGYDQGMQDMEMLQLKAQTQAKQWGSGAVGVYQRKVVPEINVASAEMERQQNSDRSGAIGMQAAQYDSGGVISHFGDFSTGPNSGFIHARFGETVMNPMASMLHGPTLNAMNRGFDLGRGPVAGLSGGGNGGGGGTIQITVQALDAKGVSDWLRMGGAQLIQSHLNANAGRYAGKALS